MVISMACPGRYTGGGRTFINAADAREFRKLVYEHYGETITTVVHTPVDW